MLVKDDRHLLCTIFAKPEKFQMAKRLRQSSINAHRASTIKAGGCFNSEEFSGMKIAEGSVAVRVGAFRDHRRLHLQSF